MANVVHSTLTGADLHEPKGVAAAAANTVYTADGVGSGAWSTGSTLIGITGQVADFATPLPPTGWLECDGTAVSRSTFSNLFSAVTIQQTGTRTNASAIITGLTSTTNMRVGYFIGGVGITNGTTILTVDSATQVTMSANAGSSGSGTIIVSPFAQGDGTTTFTLPNTVDRYRRSRGASRLGIQQTDATRLTSHTHPISLTSTGTGSGTVSGTTAGQSATHTHGVTVSGTTGGVLSQHFHTVPFVLANNVTAGPNAGGAASGSTSTTADGPDHTHNVTSSGTSGANNSDHTHSFSGSASITSITVTGSGTSGDRSTVGDTETRPISVVLMTCIKT